MIIRKRTVTLTEYFELATPGVFAFLNSKDKLVDVRHAANMLVSLGRHITQINEETHRTKALVKDREKLVVWVLEEGVTDYHTRLLLQAQNLIAFKALGFNFYRNRPALTYRVKLVVDGNLVQVRLVNKMKSYLVVGVFLTMQKAEDFVARYYQDKEILLPIYATNQLTREALLGR